MKKYLILCLFFLLSGCRSTTTEVGVKTASNLSEAYNDYFDIGVAVTANNINSLIEEDLINEFDTFTAEYEMKWDQIQLPNKEYNFDKCDIMYEFAKSNGKKIRGHTLVWRTNVPSFIYDLESSSVSMDTKLSSVLELLDGYYTTMYNRYGDVIDVWDVVNEVIEDDENYLYRHDNIYFKLCNYDDKIFESFIADVYKMVKRVSPEVSRYYNDYFLMTNEVKRDKVITFINNINELGADVNGVGLQSHITTSITKNQVDKALFDFRENDLVASFTELDISIYENDTIAPTLPASLTLLEDYDDKLSRAYNHIFSSARENSDIVENITFWGIYDKDSWLVKDFYNYRTDFPLLFDEFYNKKKAYYIVKDFEGENESNYILSTPKDEVYTQDNIFDLYNIVAENKNGKDLKGNVVIHNTELLNIENGRITQFGSFNLRYTIVVNNKVIAQVYRNIKVVYNRDSKGGLLYNSDFKAGLNEWGVVDWKKSLDVVVENSKLTIQQKSVDENIWDQSIYQYVDSLEIGKKYKIVFTATATTDKYFKVCVAQVFPIYPYSYNVTNEEEIFVNDIPNEHTISIVCKEPNNLTEGFDFNINAVRLEFKFGKYTNENSENALIEFYNINIFEV